MKTKDAFIKNEHDEFININRIERLRIDGKESDWHVSGYTMSSVGSYFSGWHFNTREEAEAFVRNLLTIKE